jgi:membrane protein insertase Oxa1/YidC/SpoIIIJ
MEYLNICRPYIIAGIVSVILYYINSRYNKNNGKKKINRRMNNIKISVYLFIILTVILYMRDHFAKDESPENIEFFGGDPHF